MVTQSSAASRVRLILNESRTGETGTSFRSIAAACKLAVDRARKHTRHVTAAAISMAQRDKLHAILEELDETADAFERGLSMLQAGPAAEKPFRFRSLLDDGKNSSLFRKIWEKKIDHEEAEEGSWWFALSEAIFRMGSDADWIDSLIAGQAANSPARELGEATSGLLRNYQNQLLGEAERWIT